MMDLKVKRLTKTAELPYKAHEPDAGFDIFADETVEILPGQTILVSTGIAIAIPMGYYGRLKSRSGLTAKTPLRIQEGTIDAGYIGEIKVIAECKAIDYFKDTEEYIAMNYGRYTINKGDKIAQLIIQPLPEVQLYISESLDDTDRGEGGFGSSGY